MKQLLITIAVLTGIFARAVAQDGTIRVEFVNSDTKAVFAVAHLPPDKLPDKFGPKDMIDLKGEEWVVLAADPPLKADFLKLGKLTLLVSQAAKMYPGKSLGTTFSMPSMSGGIGYATGNIPAGPTILSIHEDDWRQIEFVSTSYEKDIDAEIADIHKIRTEDNTGKGYSDVHIRERIMAPVSGFTLKDLADLLPPLKKFDAVGFQREHGTLPRSFAWVFDSGLAVWGLTDEQGNVTQLCLMGSPQKEDIAAVSTSLARLTLKYDLFLVDWCKETKLHGDIPDFEKYFNSKQGGN